MRSTRFRSEQGSNLRGETPLDFKSNALTTRPSLLQGEDEGGDTLVYPPVHAQRRRDRAGRAAARSSVGCGGHGGGGGWARAWLGLPRGRGEGEGARPGLRTLSFAAFGAAAA